MYIGVRLTAQARAKFYMAPPAEYLHAMCARHDEVVPLLSTLRLYYLCILVTTSTRRGRVATHSGQTLRK